jgi:hypothetical protein
MDPMLEREFDLRLQLPNHALFVGASMSGKTQLVLRILASLEACLTPVPRLILFYYDQHQEEYERLKRLLKAQGVEMLLRQGGGDLTLDDLEKRPEQTLVIVDDASEETASSAAIARITTNGRHKNLSLWLIWHSLYSRHPASRIIAQNVGYIFFLPSARLGSQIHSLDTQLRYNGALSGAYNEAMEEANRDDRYLLLDLATTTPNQLRLRSGITSAVCQSVYLR